MWAGGPSGSAASSGILLSLQRRVIHALQTANSILSPVGKWGIRELGKLERTAGCNAAEHRRPKTVIQNELPGQHHLARAGPPARAC